MIERHYLEFFLSGSEEDIVHEVRQDSLIRLRRVLDEASEGGRIAFYAFRCLDGTTLVVNLRHVQAARFISDFATAVADTIHSTAPVVVCLQGRCATTP